MITDNILTGEVNRRGIGAIELAHREGVTMVAPFGASLHVSGRDEAALEAIEGPLFIDLADSKAELRSFLDAHGFAAVRPFTRMLYGTSTHFDDAARTFAVVGPEFG